MDEANGILVHYGSDVRNDPVPRPLRELIDGAIEEPTEEYWSLHPLCLKKVGNHFMLYTLQHCDFNISA